MEEWVIEKIIQINQEFYQKFADSFSATRSQVQPGVARLLERTSDGVNWLDIGCGNGTLALACLTHNRSLSYYGCDFSQQLLDDAQKKTAEFVKREDVHIEFQLVDINRADWDQNLPARDWHVVSLFAVLHHIPSQQQRRSLMHQLRHLVGPKSCLYLSVWQLQNSLRLLPRVKPWEIVGISHREVEQGDVLMDWRAGFEEKSMEPALRYVHIFSETELQELAAEAGFTVAETFYSDGREGNLALYQVWR